MSNDERKKLSPSEADFNRWMEEEAKRNGESAPRLRWRVVGYDTFAGERYAISAHGSEAEARAEAQNTLATLARDQPAETSGGQSGIQDRILIIHPEGREEIISP